jgi:hypothetical protein
MCVCVCVCVYVCVTVCEHGVVGQSISSFGMMMLLTGKQQQQPERPSLSPLAAAHGTHTMGLEFGSERGEGRGLVDLVSGWCWGSEDGFVAHAAKGEKSKTCAQGGDDEKTYGCSLNLNATSSSQNREGKRLARVALMGLPSHRRRSIHLGDALSKRHLPPLRSDQSHPQNW